MRVKKKEIVTMELKLDAAESKLMKEILNYVWHRASKHSCYVSKFSQGIEQMRREFENAEDDFELDTDVDIFNN